MIETLARHATNTEFENWGLIDYREALGKQDQLVEAVSADPARETVIFCRHPAVVTLGFE